MILKFKFNESDYEFVKNELGKITPNIEQALLKLAQAMKDNAPTQEDKQNVHVFLMNVPTAEDTTKTANLKMIKILVN